MSAPILTCHARLTSLHCLDCKDHVS